MSKAFDKVQHCILLEKLRTINIKGIYTLGFLRIYVDGNSALLFQVVHHFLTSQLPQSGVPQVNVLLTSAWLIESSTLSYLN